MINWQKGNTLMPQMICCYNYSKTSITLKQKAHCKSTLQCDF